MRGRDGLTIIETLIAITVIGVVFVALAGLQITSMRVTTDARVDSDLLQVAVGAFEDARTIVLANYEDIFQTCPLEGDCATELLSDVAVRDPYVRRVAAQRAGGYVKKLEDGDEVDVYTAFPGLLELEVEVTDGRGRQLLFKQYVSCLDGNVLPTMSDPAPCVVPTW